MTKTSRRHVTHLLMRFSLAALTAGLATSTMAEPIADANEALRKQDPAGAIRILEQAAAGGNLAAKGMLASSLRNFPAPYKDLDRACRLAREAADAGDDMGAVTRAECLITGTEKSDRAFGLARELARKALKSGSSAAGFTLYQTFVLDPKYTYLQGNTTDVAKYNALAATPVAARSEQIEAFNGLALAFRSGQVNAMYMSLTYLLDSSAPGNIDRVLAIAAIAQKSNTPIPELMSPYLRFAQTVKQLGTTNASVSAFNNAYKPAFLAAALQIRGTGAGAIACEDKLIKLMHVEAEPVTNAEYLPIDAPLSNTYLVHGKWNEAWTFSGCEKTVTIPMAFEADGWSGAKFNTTFSASKIPPAQ